MFLSKPLLLSLASNCINNWKSVIIFSKEAFIPSIHALAGKQFSLTDKVKGLHDYSREYSPRLSLAHERDNYGKQNTKCPY